MPIEVFPPAGTAHDNRSAGYSRNYCPESLVRLALFPRKANSKLDDKVYRIEGPVLWVKRNEAPEAATKPPSIQDWLESAQKIFPGFDDYQQWPPSMVVLWDRNNGFRHNWPSPPSSSGEKGMDRLKSLLTIVEKARGTIVWQRRRHSLMVATPSGR